MTKRELVRLANCRQALRNGDARRLRLDAGVSLAEMADTLGVDAAVLHRWENGVHMPRPINALRLADVLDALYDRERLSV